MGLWGIVVQEPDSLMRMANAKIGVNIPISLVIGGYLVVSTFGKCLWPIAALGFLAA